MGFIQFLFGKKEESEEEIMGEPKVHPDTFKDIGKIPYENTGIEIKADVRNVTARFELWQSEADSQWYFRLVASNNRTICCSEGYTRKSNAENGIASVKMNAPKAKIELLE